MSIDFYSRLEKSTEKSNSSSAKDFYSRLSDKKEIPKAGRLGAQYAIGAAELAAFPYEVAVAPLASKDTQAVGLREKLFEEIERLGEKKRSGRDLSGEWDEQDQTILNNLMEQINDPEAMEKFVKTADIGIGGLVEKGAEAFGYDLKPKDTSEHIARIGGNIINPKNLAKAPVVIKSWVNKEARRAIKLEKQWKNLDRATASNPEKETLLKFAKEKGLTPEETTLLFHSKGDAKTFSKFAKKTKRFKKTVAGLKSKLGNEYDSLKELGREGGNLTLKESESLTQDLGKIMEEIGETYFEGPDTKTAKAAIEETIKNIYNKPGTVKDLITTRQEIKQGVNWNNVDKGDALKTQADKAILESIKNKNPYVHDRLIKNDLAYSKYKQFEDVLKDKTIRLKYKGIELPVDATQSLAYGVSYILGGWKGVAIKEGLQRLSTELAINPAFQKPIQKLQNALLKGSRKSQKQALISIKNIAKEQDPDLYEEIKDLDL